MSTTATDFANLNVRVSAESHAILKATAARYNTSINAVVNALFEYMLLPENARVFWNSGIKALQELCLKKGAFRELYLTDVDDKRFHEIDSLLIELQGIGFVENYITMPAEGMKGRMICSFSLTQAGRIIGAILHECGGFENGVRDLLRHTAEA